MAKPIPVPLCSIERPIFTGTPTPCSEAWVCHRCAALTWWTSRHRAIRYCETCKGRLRPALPQELAQARDAGKAYSPQARDRWHQELFFRHPTNHRVGIRIPPVLYGRLQDQLRGYPPNIEASCDVWRVEMYQSPYPLAPVMGIEPATLSVIDRADVYLVGTTTLLYPVVAEISTGNLYQGETVSWQAVTLVTENIGWRAK